MEVKASEIEKPEEPELEEGAEEEFPVAEDSEVEPEQEEKPKKAKVAERFKKEDGSLKSFVKEEKNSDGWIVKTYKRSESSKIPGQLYYTYTEPGPEGSTFYSKKQAMGNGYKP